MDDPMTDAIDPYKNDDAENIEQKITNEEYKIWKKNAVWLYDLLFARALEWPTLTVQWLPDKRAVPGTDYTEHRVVMATHTSGQAQDYLQIAKIEMPTTAPADPANYNEERGEIGSHGSAKKPFAFEIIQKINTPSEVNKARYQPQNPEIIATIGPPGRVMIFDRTKHPLTPKDDQIIPQLELVGHTGDGYGLDWSPFHEGQLATGTEDQTVCLWDIKSNFSRDATTIKPQSIYRHHSATVNDVQHHPIHNSWVGSVSDDLTVCIIDTRKSPSSSPALQQHDIHSDAVNCMQFHPSWETILATGSADGTIGLWDLRNMDKKLHSFETHKEAVMSIEWHPRDTAVFASSSYDKRICMWDLSKIGEEQTPEEAEDGPPELLFMHGGFTNRVSDFSWNKNDPWVMLAAAEDNQMQIFRPARALVDVVKPKAQNRDVEE